MVIAVEEFERLTVRPDAQESAAGQLTEATKKWRTKPSPGSKSTSLERHRLASDKGLSVRCEYPLDCGGRADYALFDRRSPALTVLEAKSTSVSLSASEAQAAGAQIETGKA